MHPSDDEFDPSMLDELCLLARPGEDLLRRLVELFHRDAPRHLAELRDGLESGSALRLHRASHTMKGAAGNLGLLALAARCEVVVEATRQHELEPGIRIGEAEIAAIEAAVEDAMRYLQQRVRQD